MTGCLDFADPILPSRGAAAVASARVSVTNQGSVELSLHLLPGLDSAGVPRDVSSRHARLLDRTVEPDSVTRREWIYHAMWMTEPGNVIGPIVFEAPTVRNVAAPPSIVWYGVRRIDPDTLHLDAGADLRLRLDANAGASQPSPSQRQWVVTLATDNGVFRLGADGVPPDTILVPSRWIPPGDPLRVQMIWTQTADIRQPPGDYIGLVTLDARVSWTVRVGPRAASRGEGARSG